MTLDSSPQRPASSGVSSTASPFPLVEKPGKRLAKRAAAPATERERRALANTLLVSGAAIATASAAYGAWQIRAEDGDEDAGRVALYGGLAALAGLLGARLQWARLFEEGPPYTVEAHHGALEVRRYPARLVAETWAEGETFGAALNEGFHRLAGYVFGGNRGHERIPMSVPVHVSPNRSTSAALDGHTGRAVRTAPDAPPASARTEASEGLPVGLLVGFPLPAGRSLEALPAPFDPRVTLRPVPSTRVAVMRFRGRLVMTDTSRYERALLEAARRAGLEPHGRVHFAAYDAPQVLPWIRRNEVWTDVA